MTDRVTKLADMLMTIQNDVLAGLSLAERNLVQETFLEITLVCHGLTVTQRRMLFECFYLYYKMVEDLSEKT